MIRSSVQEEVWCDLIPVCSRNTGKAARIALDLCDGGGVRGEFKVRENIVCTHEYFMKDLVKSVLC